MGLFGYNWGKEAKKRVVNPPEADIVREIFFKIANGKSSIVIWRGFRVK
jgi:hypothetical protein